MARSDAVWGIDVGQCALKALRCRPHEDATRVVADAFDYIEYPKILSQPEADPDELIRDALKEFLSRNTLRGDRVAISVSGQSGLARFIKLPPVESKKIPDIVKYEARQQIPFALEDVVWDYQRLAGGSEEEGFSLETEVGLFAMKRDQVQRALSPFQEQGVEVDIVQLTPLALYNYIVFDQLSDLPPPDEYDPDNPPDSLVLLSMGTDTTDLVVTNGYRVWQRSIPLGGNQFTKALTKELKLTYAKAEHLKRNASQSENPKQVFQAMRPVFSDLVTEVQRSIGYFTSLDREAKISRVIGLGNAMKLPGLQRYLAQHLGLDVARADRFERLDGAEVVDAPAFKENVLSFVPCYGLALQGIRETAIRTNLVPPELVKERFIRAKKPWAVAAAAVLMLGMTVSLFGHWRAWRSTHPDLFGAADAAAGQVISKSGGFKGRYNSAKSNFTTTDEIGKHLVHFVEGRRTWLELLTAINMCLPRDEEGQEKGPADREEVIITSLDCQYVDDLSTWHQTATTGENSFGPLETERAARAAEQAAVEGDAPDGLEDPNAAPPELAQAPAATGFQETTEPPPSGAGWVFELSGHHFNNHGDLKEGAKYVQESLLWNLSQPEIEVQRDGQTVRYPVGKLGIKWPLLLGPIQPIEDYELPDPRSANEDEPRMIQLRRYNFTVQFCWQEPPPEELQAAMAEAGIVPSAEEAASTPRGGEAVGGGE